MNKKELIEEMEFVKNSNAEISIVDDKGNEYFIDDFGTDLNNSHISILIKKEINIEEESNKIEQCGCWSKYGKSLNSGMKCSNCGREL